MEDTWVRCMEPEIKSGKGRGDRGTDFFAVTKLRAAAIVS